MRLWRRQSERPFHFFRAPDGRCCFFHPASGVYGICSEPFFVLGVRQEVSGLPVKSLIASLRWQFPLAVLANCAQELERLQARLQQQSTPPPPVAPMPPRSFILQLEGVDNSLMSEGVARHALDFIADCARRAGFSSVNVTYQFASAQVLPRLRARLDEGDARARECHVKIHQRFHTPVHAAADEVARLCWERKVALTVAIEEAMLQKAEAALAALCEQFRLIPYLLSAEGTLSLHGRAPREVAERLIRLGFQRVALQAAWMQTEGTMPEDEETWQQLEAGWEDYARWFAEGLQPGAEHTFPCLNPQDFLGSLVLRVMQREKLTPQHLPAMSQVIISPDGSLHLEDAWLGMLPGGEVGTVTVRNHSQELRGCRHSLPPPPAPPARRSRRKKPDGKAKKPPFAARAAPLPAREGLGEGEGCVSNCVTFDSFIPSTLSPCPCDCWVRFLCGGRLQGDVGRCDLMKLLAELAVWVAVTFQQKAEETRRAWSEKVNTPVPRVRGSPLVLWCSRGRGAGHATKDMAIAQELRQLRPDVRVQFVSYDRGADTFRRSDVPVVDLELPENHSLLETQQRVALLMERYQPQVVVCHEEFALPPVARSFKLPCLFITHWFLEADHPWMQMLNAADEIIFIEEPGIFPTPPVLQSKTIFVGAVVRPFAYTRRDRERARSELGIVEGTFLVVGLPGRAWTEQKLPLFDTTLEAFDWLPVSSKLLIWVADADVAELSARVRGRPDVRILEFERIIDRLMVASDVTLTKASYTTMRELDTLGALCPVPKFSAAPCPLPSATPRTPNLTRGAFCVTLQAR